MGALPAYGYRAAAAVTLACALDNAGLALQAQRSTQHVLTGSDGHSQGAMRTHRQCFRRTETAAGKSPRQGDRAHDR